ncbi:H(+)/Cl(-) exchange transporter 6-like [Lineus longissimus]|uniref:H(+)/Cl(-) exchange transporter 6-like n=1 Tax=Lineus longissimus TaxID=88925 RepID=UPI002B4D3065
MANEVYQSKWSYNKVGLVKWVLTFFVGFLTAMVALFIDSIVKLLTEWKFSTVDESIQQCSKDGCLVLSLLLLLAFNVIFVAISAIFVAIEPNAGGSGIPEVKCYLNGVKVPMVVRLKTLVCKAVGVLFSVSGGLFVGKEGPMIHSGAVVGAGLPQFQSISCQKVDFKYAVFRSDRDKRDFVSGGAAAGVAAAFGAPIGGVLFSLEEGSSFWNQKLTWRTFFCSMSASFSLNFFLSGMSKIDGKEQWGYFYLPGLINFGVFSCPEDQPNCRLWSGWDLLIFLLMGIIGGLLGALFNQINKLLTVYRLKYVTRKPKVFNILEAILIAATTTTVAFMAAMCLGQCKKLAEHQANATVRTYFCDKGEYNDMATLFFNPSEAAIKQLFHLEGNFSLPSLAIFFICFFFLACWTYGCGVPSGLFVPALLCGASYGRFVSTILYEFLGYQHGSSGTFALIGAAAFLGGIVRMTISLNVILIEATNEISLGLPLMIVLLVAKWVGDFFNEGIYDIHIELKGVPLLGWEPPFGVHKLRAKDIMDTDIMYMYPHSRVGSIIQMLRTTSHNAFPVVTLEKSHKADNIKRLGRGRLDHNIKYRIQSLVTREGEHRRRLISLSPSTRVLELTATASSEESGERRGRVMSDPHLSQRIKSDPYEPEESDDHFQPLRFHGIILRSQLTVLIEKGVCYSETEPETHQPKVNYEEMMGKYPRFPDIFDLNVTDEEKAKIMDVTPYMNPCPYNVLPETPMMQVFHLFRSMGLRHLPVVNSRGEIVGILTRHNLTLEALEEKIVEVDAKANLLSSNTDDYTTTA